MPVVQLLQREAVSLFHEIHEPEIPGAEHDHVSIRDVVLRPLLLLRPGRLSDCVADHRLLLVAARDLCDAAALERTLDELVEPVAVPLLEGRALRLAVVGKHDELIWPGRVTARPLDPAELLVELSQCLHRVGTLEAGVVRDLVVARERGVHGRPSSPPARKYALPAPALSYHAE